MIQSLFFTLYGDYVKDAGETIWLPFQSSYYIIQPYVKGVVFTDVDGYLIYFYNTMYYE